MCILRFVDQEGIARGSEKLQLWNKRINASSTQAEEDVREEREAASKGQGGHHATHGQAPHQACVP